MGSTRDDKERIHDDKGQQAHVEAAENLDGERAEVEDLKAVGSRERAYKPVLETHVEVIS